jgi:hypothetical protein
MLSVAIKSIMLSVIMPSVFKLYVMAPVWNFKRENFWSKEDGATTFIQKPMRLIAIGQLGSVILN